MKPILFNTEMVRAILEGRKTVTRRVLKPQPDKEHKHMLGFVSDSYSDKKHIGWYGFGTMEVGYDIQYAKPPYKVNDVLYVRETWCKLGKLDEFEQHIDGTDEYYYRADGSNPTPYDYFIICGERRDSPRWYPSIHMPKEAARIFLRVTAVRVERLQDIEPEDAVREGTKETFPPLAVDEFRNLWNSTLGRKGTPEYYGNSWAGNPFVWVIEFERITKEQAYELDRQ